MKLHNHGKGGGGGGGMHSTTQKQLQRFENTTEQIWKFICKLAILIVSITNILQALGGQKRNLL